MSAGAHRLQISAVLESNGVRLEGEKSVALDLVVVTRAVAAASNAEAHAATTADDALLAETLATGLDGPSSLAMTPDGRLFIAERSGDVRVWQDRQVLPLAALQASDASPDAEVGLLGLAIHPDFAHNRQVYLAYTARSDNGVLTNRVVRYREVNNIFGQGAVILEDVVTASPVRTPRIQFGPDRKLYVAFPAGPDQSDAQDLASYVGKILRLNDDGTTPSDNPRYSPIVSSGQGAALAFGWQPATGFLWQIDRDWSARNVLRRPGLRVDPLTSLLAVDVAADQRSRAFSLSPPIDASAAAFFASTSVSRFAGDLFIAALAGQEIRRVRFDPLDPTRIIATERLLDHAFGRISDVMVGSDGSLYFCTSNRSVFGQQLSTNDDRLVRVSPQFTARDMGR